MNGSIQQINSDPVGLFRNAVSKFLAPASPRPFLSAGLVDVGSLLSPLGWGREKWRFAHCLKAWLRLQQMSLLLTSTGRSEVRLIKVKSSYVLFL